MTNSPPTPAPRLEAVLDAFRRASLSPTAGYRLIKAGKFPQLIKRGRRSYVLAAEVDGWIQTLLDQQRAKVGP